MTYSGTYNAIYKFIKNIVVFTDELSKLSIKALFESVKSIERIRFVQIPGYTPEIIDIALLLNCPADHLPLEQIVRHLSLIHI